MTISSPSVPAPPAPINWPKVAFLWAASITVAGWVAMGATANQRLHTLEQRTQPLADGDLVRVQNDVAWIRGHLEREDG